MTDPRNAYGFPDIGQHRDNNLGNWLNILKNSAGASFIGYRHTPTKLERAQAYAADVRQRRGMVVRKGFYVDLKP